ncbi:MAG TPA: UDP-3-O-acyl-N-acetylglucosamine deacetylase [Longimicrobiaceae bacterium]|nr:UDP-3-O-acyl-N-acetylglucosamine deacetylase [Longimicrobiaceae bacterium]
MKTPRQQTISSARAVEGVGLHTGGVVHLRLLPAPINTGIVFRRTDLADAPEIPALAGHVMGTDRGTNIGLGEARVHTVEHLLAAISGAGIDNIFIELDAAEPPAGDGSAKLFTDLLAGSPPEEQDAPIRTIEVAETFSVCEGNAQYIVAPADSFRISTTIDFDHPLIGRQFGSFEVTPESFARELASARTFGFLREVEALRARGLAQGGSARNAVVLTDDGLLEGIELRYTDEFMRHKTLDIVGDLALVGAHVNAHIVAERPSHQGNVALARELMERADRRALARPILDVQQILQYLPHRYPFLLVDRVVEFEERKRIVGLKNVTINEPFFVGHFPGHPIMPGVLIIEAMAQVGGLLMVDTIENPEEKIVYFMSLDNVKWRRPVTPGDQIRFEVEVTQIRGRTCRMKGVGTVDGQVVAEAEMMARVVDR